MLYVYRRQEEPTALVLTSNSFKEGATLANEHILSANFGFGTDGGNKYPHLAWSGAPAGTKSFAISCFDPDDERKEMRTRWWDPSLTTFKTAYMGPSADHIPDLPIPHHLILPTPDRPTFIGHWVSPV